MTPAPYIITTPRCGHVYIGQTTGIKYECVLSEGHEDDHVDQGVFW